MLIRFNIRHLCKLSITSTSLSLSRYICHKKMNTVYIRHTEPAERFEITFSFNDKNINVSRQFNMKRDISESVEGFLSRLKHNVQKVVDNKSKRRKKLTNVSVEPSDVEVTLKENGILVDGSRICKDVFFSDNFDLSLQVCGQDYNIVVNPPWILSLGLPNNLISGSYAYPYKFGIINGSKSSSNFVWFKSDTSGRNWQQIASGTLLHVSDELIGGLVKLECTPSNGSVDGPSVVVKANTVVKQGPKDCPFELRHSYTRESLPENSFRVVSYNILADVYAETITARTELFPYCPPFAMNIDYRKQLYIKELLGYKADIICLQEVDSKIFNNDLVHVFEDYEGVLTKKLGNVAEGVATFYSKRKFRLVEHKEISFAEEIDKNPVFSEIWEAIKNNEAVVKTLKERTTVFQALILESCGQLVVVGNTHLYFLPEADHLRLIQGGMAVKFLVNIVLKLVNEGKKTSLVFCGDMNSTPDCGLYLLMTKNKAPADLPDWSSDKNEVVKGLELTQPFEMHSAYGSPPFTNYTVGFKGCLDYIYYQADVLQLMQTVPIPPEEVLKADQALPSPVFPSDHVALIADFQWISSN